MTSIDPTARIELRVSPAGPPHAARAAAPSATSEVRNNDVMMIPLGFGLG